MPRFMPIRYDPVRACRLPCFTGLWIRTLCRSYARIWGIPNHPGSRRCHSMGTRWLARRFPSMTSRRAKPNEEKAPATSWSAGVGRSARPRTRQPTPNLSTIAGPPRPVLDTTSPCRRSDARVIRNQRPDDRLPSARGVPSGSSHPDVEPVEGTGTNESGAAKPPCVAPRAHHTPRPKRSRWIGRAGWILFSKNLPLRS